MEPRNTTSHLTVSAEHAAGCQGKKAFSAYAAHKLVEAANGFRPATASWDRKRKVLAVGRPYRCAYCHNWHIGGVTESDEMPGHTKLRAGEKRGARGLLAVLDEADDDGEVRRHKARKPTPKTRKTT